MIFHYIEPAHRSRSGEVRFRVWGVGFSIIFHYTKRAHRSRSGQLRGNFAALGRLLRAAEALAVALGIEVLLEDLDNGTVDLFLWATTGEDGTNY